MCLTVNVHTRARDRVCGFVVSTFVFSSFVALAFGQFDLAIRERSLAGPGCGGVGCCGVRDPGTGMLVRSAWQSGPPIHCANLGLSSLFQAGNVLGPARSPLSPKVQSQTSVEPRLARHIHDIFTSKALKPPLALALRLTPNTDTLKKSLGRAPSTRGQ